MIQKVKSELLKTIKMDPKNISRRKYAVSSLGRAASYGINLYEDGKILNGSITIARSLRTRSTGSANRRISL